MKKHSFLIIAHNNFDVLEKLLRLLDDFRNDIFVHVDSKVDNFDFDYFKKIITKSTLIFTERIDVQWGGYSLVECKLLLLKSAIRTEEEYSYYHLLSGVDLPIKSNDYIHHFFNENDGKEFIGYIKDFGDLSRIKYYHLFNELGRKVDFNSKIKKFINKLLLLLQKLSKINRINNKEFFRGANWFSISNNLASFVVESEPVLKKIYAYTILSDECFLQTLVYNSDFYDKVFKRNEHDTGHMRLIDWHRGKPYIYIKNDYNELMQSEMLFARKFDAKIDADIIDAVYDKVTSMNK